MLVEERRWLTSEEFLRGLSIAQAVPGPNAVNLAVFVGHRFHGTLGSMAAVGSVFVVPLAALSLLAVGWARWGGVPSVAGALGALAAFGAALMASTGITMFRAASLRRTETLLAAAAFAAVALLRLPVPAVLAALLPLSIWLQRSGGGRTPEDAR
jgi:chromate transporter